MPLHRLENAMPLPDSIAALGPVMQLAFVPRNIDAALSFWTHTMGVGPFFRFPHIRYERATFQGAPTSIDFSVHIAQWGPVQIELVSQHCSSPSVYRSFLDAGHDGLHHVCISVTDIDAAKDVCAAAGAPILFEVSLGGTEAFYADPGSGPGTLVEIVQPAPALATAFAAIAEAGRNWDGRDPVRSFPS
jgi:catechol 2,3-dioxygenase-like lactoylglutathione lyase family enzyme